MKIPYGRSNFADIRRGNFFYVDKTPFLPHLESGDSGYAHLLFLRPRRMGKSLLVSMLEHYYDLGWADQFDALFGGLWIHEHPTPERNSYLVLTLDFSVVATDGGEGTLRRTFLEAVRSPVLNLILRHGGRFPDLVWLRDRLDSFTDAESLLSAVMSIVSASGKKLYVLIDEYDTFANSLLSAGGENLYTQVVDRTGFIRTFYRALKTGTRSGAIGRIFITGVTPILLDDLASGFNIISHVSQHPTMNTLAGFTRADVERAVDELLAATPGSQKDPRLADQDALLRMLEEYYNGYRFSPEATERVFNSEMVLYFLQRIRTRANWPSDMLDPNVRIDYGRLQRLGLLSGAPAEGRREILSTIVAEGHIHGKLVEQFGAKNISTREQFLSLLYYIGMLTLSAEQDDETSLRLEIPNRVIRELSWSHLAHMLEDEDKLGLDTHVLEESLRIMAIQGDITPFLDIFHTRVVKAIGIKDLRNLSEKAIKLMLIAFISLSQLFHPLSEKEFAQGLLRSLPRRLAPPAGGPLRLDARAEIPPHRRGERGYRGGLHRGRGAARALFVRPAPLAAAHPGPRPEERRAGLHRRTGRPLPALPGTTGLTTMPRLLIARSLDRGTRRAPRYRRR